MSDPQLNAIFVKLRRNHFPFSLSLILTNQFDPPKYCSYTQVQQSKPIKVKVKRV